ncbi:deleted in malignant brain tumors 1 protein-like isoform X2 [Hemiscyllium ocellatum]|uniref:deleted in malignant brain tumors 1 protein-like isoform X2 n=1 Tax=Hemiscyllium ocellatum TaxID=170820 RepID=UPI002966C0A4|nr:deleted in malignant brain tumors 1 protein-like isoform X2 [Hemiscyllium ocellatum]
MGCSLVVWTLLLAWIDRGLVGSQAVTPKRPHQDVPSSLAPHPPAITPTSPLPEVPVRLTNGTSECSGRVELLHLGSWRPLCWEFWDGRGADVVCRQVGCGQGRPGGVGSTAPVPGPFWVVLMNCTGGEGDWRACPGRPLPANQPCDRNLAAEVTCTEHKEIRLQGGGSRCVGRVELHSHGTWGTVCDDSWGLGAADVVCRQLGCGHALRATNGSKHGQGWGPIYLDEVRCRGDEAYLWKCPSQPWEQHDCGHKEDAGVECSGHREIALTGGVDRCSGQVRVRDQGTWGSLCHRGADRSLAERVCRHLGCGNATAVRPSYPLEGEHAWVGQCQNGTGAVPACFRKVPPASCQTGGAAGVTCAGSVYLTDLPSNVSINVIPTESGGTDGFPQRGENVLLLVIALLVLLLVALCALFAVSSYKMRRRMVMQFRQASHGDGDVEGNDYREMTHTPGLNHAKPPALTVPARPVGEADSLDEDYEDYDSFAPRPALQFSTFQYSGHSRSQRRNPGPTTFPEIQTGTSDRGQRSEVPYQRSTNDASSSEDERSQAASAKPVRRASKPRSQRWKKEQAVSAQSAESSSTSSCEWYENTKPVQRETQPQATLLVVPQQNDFQSSTSTLPLEEYENVTGTPQNVPEQAVLEAASEAARQPCEDSSENDYDDIGTYFTS